MTVGKFVFVSDPKYSIKHIPYKNEWNLVIDKIKPRHAGFYECQISTKKDMKRYVQLNIIGKCSVNIEYKSVVNWKGACSRQMDVDANQRKLKNR